MGAYTEHRCSRCGNLCSKELLTVKRVQFHPLGFPKKVIKSRATEWLCEACVAKDPDFNQPSYSGPGNLSPALQRVREDRVIE